VLRDMEGFAGAQGFEVCGIEESCLRGPMGNREFFLYLRNPAPRLGRDREERWAFG